MKKSILTSAIVLSLVQLTPAFAQTATPRIDHRQDNQQTRINQGVSSGALTASETQTLQKRETKIEADKQLAKADGVVTKSERHQLRHEENRASHAIARKKHNNRVAP